MKHSRYQQPRMIESKFQCTCAETGKTIRKGERCLYYPAGKKVYHVDSNQAYEWRNAEMDEDVLSAQEPEGEYNSPLSTKPKAKAKPKAKTAKPEAKPTQATTPTPKAEPKQDKATEQFKTIIKRFLANKAMTDELFEKYYTNEKKNIDDCVTFILNSVKKSGECGFTDDEIFSMAIHYYQEDNIEVGAPISGVTIINNRKVELTEEEKAEARQRAIDQLANEIKNKTKAKPTPKATPAPAKKDTKADQKPQQTELTLF